MNFEMCMKRECKLCKNNEKCFKEEDESNEHLKIKNSNITNNKSYNRHNKVKRL